MTTTIAGIAEAFSAHLPSALTGWPSADVLNGLEEGELWVAKDLTAEACPRSAWIAGRPVYATDWTAVDAQGRARAFRRLDRDWYVWLYHAAQRACTRLEQAQPDVWRELAARFNALWSLACRWWGNDEVGLLHRDHVLDTRYESPAVYILASGIVQRSPGSGTPAAGLPAGFNAWPYTLRMEHAAACTRVLRDEHSIITDPRGNYIGPEGVTHEELIRTAVAVARHVAAAMRGKAAA
jgi:hypothetical protein